MTWKLLVGVLVIPYMIAAFWTATMQASPTLAGAGGDQAAFGDFLNVAAQPNEVHLTQPTIGGDAPLSTTLVLPTNPIGWAGFLANAAALRGPMWEGWTTPIRIMLLAFAAPAILFFMMMLYQALGFMIGGIAGAVRP
jgi:hypothetical protein